MKCNLTPTSPGNDFFFIKLFIKSARLGRYACFYFKHLLVFFSQCEVNTYTENQLTVYSLKGQVSRFLSILDLLQVIFITSFQSIKSNE